MKLHMLLCTALLISTSFFPQSLWWGGMLALLLLAGTRNLLTSRTGLRLLCASMGAWYGISLWWVAKILHCDMGASCFVAASLYVIVIGYLLFITFLYFFLAGHVLRYYKIGHVWGFVWQGSFFLLFFFLLTHHALWFFPGIGGAVFHHPLLPVGPALVKTTILSANDWHSVGATSTFVYPLLSSESLTARSRSETAQGIYQLLTCIPASQTKKGGAFIVSPESYFCYPLASDDYEIVLWTSQLPVHVKWLFGGVRKAGRWRHQTVFELEKGRIMHTYDKKNYVEFFEYTPKNFFKHILSALFSPEVGQFTKLLSEYSHTDVLIAPLLCADLFHEPLCPTKFNILFFNETWFPKNIRFLFYSYACWKVACLRCPLLFVGHEKCLYIEPIFWYSSSHYLNENLR